MVVNNATYSQQTGYPSLVLDTDLGEVIIDITGIKESLLNLGLVYVGYEEVLPVIEVRPDDEEPQSLVGFTSDAVVVKLTRQFMVDANRKSFKPGPVPIA